MRCFFVLWEMGGLCVFFFFSDDGGGGCLVVFFGGMVCEVSYLFSKGINGWVDMFFDILYFL